MKNHETIPDYFGRVLTISNQMRSNGEEVMDTEIVEKILRTLSEKYMYAMVSIVESNNLEEMTVEELQSSLIVHEKSSRRLTKKKNIHSRSMKMKDQVAVVEEGDLVLEEEDVVVVDHRLTRRPSSATMSQKHFSYECPSMGEKEANYPVFNENEDVMLMGESEIEEHVLMALTNDDGRNPLRFLDTGCSNHMCGIIEKFVTFDQSFSTTVILGNNTRMNVGGKGNVKLRIEGTTFIVQDVYYVAELKNSFLSGRIEDSRVSLSYLSQTHAKFFKKKGVSCL
ncbi:uncharacterized protein LOC143586897 [Bidens hawaiensis]|uniref:uncharacterized protein LOC143586897 n=1 Tax=Bidens hawaiensis TaxID=980011 RepID=UPI00404B88A4